MTHVPRAIGHGQFADLRVQSLDPGLVDRGLLRRIAALEELRCTFQERLLPWMDPKTSFGVGCTPNRLASSDAVCSPFSASSATFALNSGLCCFRFDIVGLLKLATNRHGSIAYVTVRLAGSGSIYEDLLELLDEVFVSFQEIKLFEQVMGRVSGGLHADDILGASYGILRLRIENPIGVGRKESC